MPTVNSGKPQTYLPRRAYGHMFAHKCLGKAMFTPDIMSVIVSLLLLDLVIYCPLHFSQGNWEGGTHNSPSVDTAFLTCAFHPLTRDFHCVSTVLLLGRQSIQTC